jgi:uncharacterized protein VirK/YbjX
LQQISIEVKVLPAKSAAPRSHLRQNEAAADFTRRTTQLFQLLLHPVIHVQYSKAVNLLVLQGVAFGNVFLTYKYLGDYLAKSFSSEWRRIVILSHYRFIDAVISKPNIAIINNVGLSIWQRSIDNAFADIRLTIAKDAPMEGEWQLQYFFNNEMVYNLTFVFGPLPSLGGDGEVACLIGGLQGGYDCRTAIRAAAKANHEIAPAAMLLIACKAISAALGVNAVLGVSSREQVVRFRGAGHTKADYDALWALEGKSPQVNGFHVLSPEGAERPLSSVPTSHRRRTRLKRKLKQELLEEVTAKAASLLAVTHTRTTYSRDALILPRPDGLRQSAPFV